MAIEVRESFLLSFILLFLVSLAFGKGSDKEKRESKATNFSLSFSHKRHVSLGMECSLCQSMANSGDRAGFPAVADCMSCHQTIKTKSPAIQTLARYSREGRPVQWDLLYKLPSFVFFSHKKHTDSKIGCEECHGPVQSRDVLWKEKDISMKACVACHKSRKASVACNLCHYLNF
jgi:hypothetical protein